MEKAELALESAEIAGSGAEIGERTFSRSVKCLSFVAPAAFGEASEHAMYHTLITTEDPLTKDQLMDEIAAGIKRCVQELISGKRKRALAVGLGNPAAVVDALGSETIKRLSAGEKSRGYLATIVPSVYGVTGLESASIVRGVSGEYRPDLILAVDTLSTRRAERLCRAVQITNGGVTPGGGVGNRREPISDRTFGVPVISVGVPLLARADRCASLPAGLVVTPKEIDLLVPRFADAIATGIEQALF